MPRILGGAASFAAGSIGILPTTLREEQPEYGREEEKDQKSDGRKEKRADREIAHGRRLAERNAPNWNSVSAE